MLRKESAELGTVSAVRCVLRSVEEDNIGGNKGLNAGGERPIASSTAARQLSQKHIC